MTIKLRYLLWPVMAFYVTVAVVAEYVSEWLETASAYHIQKARACADWVLYRYDVTALDRLVRINPDRITIADVSASLHIGSRFARLILNTAVRKGVFLRINDHYKLKESLRKSEKKS